MDTLLSHEVLDNAPQEIFADVIDDTENLIINGWCAQKDNTHGIDRFIKIYLDTATMQTFFAWFLENMKDNNKEEIESLYNRKNNAPLQIHYYFTSLHKGFKSSEERPFTHKELQRSIIFLEQNHQLLKAMEHIELAMNAYFYALKHKVEDNMSLHAYPAQFNFATAAFYPISSALSVNAFINELLPIIASIKKKGEKRVSSPKFYAEGMHLAFERSAFTSIGVPPLESIRACPFKSKVAHLFATDFRRDDDGKISVAEQSKAGGLILFVMGHLEHLKNTLSSNKTLDLDY